MLQRQIQRMRGALEVGVWHDEDPVLSVVAVCLHHYYGAAESIFERIARAFEGLPDDRERRHQALLQQMSLTIGEVRPQVIGDESRAALVELLSFRHFFRRTYGADLDQEKLRRLAEIASRHHDAFQVELAAFEAVLDAASKTPGAGA